MCQQLQLAWHWLLRRLLSRRWWYMCENHRAQRRYFTTKIWKLVRWFHSSLLFLASETIIRDCLSSLQALRTDIPSDKYEGCRSAAKDVRLAHYVNNSIKELDIRRDYFDETTYCFCFLDHRCNSATNITFSVTLALATNFLIIFFKRFF